MNLLHRLIDWLCKVTGYIPKVAQQEISKNNAEIADTIDRLERSVISTNTKLMEASEKVKELQYHVDQSNVLNMEQLQEENKRVMLENDKIHKDMQEANEYYKEVQTQISELMHGDPLFGFKRSVTIPGSSTLTGVIKDDTAVVAGRMVMEDSVTAKMEQEPSLRERYYIATNQLAKYGLLDRIMQEALNLGGVQFTLAYNDNCTATELYYAMEIKTKQSMLTFGKEKEEDTEG